MRDTAGTSDRTRAAAEGAADAISEFSQLTSIGQDELRLPGDVAEIVPALSVMTGQLPQLLAQLASWLLAETRAGRVAHESATDVREPVGCVIAARSPPEHLTQRGKRALLDLTAAEHKIAA